MKIIGLNPKKFKKYFTAHSEITCLHSEFLLNRSLSRINLFLTNKNGEFNIFLGKDKEINCLKYGLKLYSRPKKYRKYISGFKNYVNSANKTFISKYRKAPKKMSKKEFKEAVKFLGKLWYYYGFTEFPYLDLAYKYVADNKNKIIEKNLKEISRFRFKARKVMNAYWFKNGVIQNILSYISKTFLKDDEAKFLYFDELFNVFAGKNPDRVVINQRKKCYSAASINGKIIKFPYKQAVKLNKLFTHIDKTNIIKGIAANFGKASGRVILAPMLNDQKAIERINKKMKKGDILVAESTSPDIMMLCRKAKAIVADQGGMLSHAAVVSRELSIPCIIQTEVATRIFKAGDFIEVDANKGIVKKL